MVTLHGHAVGVVVGLLLALMVTLTPAAPSAPVVHPSARSGGSPCAACATRESVMAREMLAGVHDARNGYLPTRMAFIHR